MTAKAPRADDPAQKSEAKAAPEFTKAQLEFFEKQVRPILQARCIKCHGGEKTKGDKPQKAKRRKK